MKKIASTIKNKNIWKLFNTPWIYLIAIAIIFRTMLGYNIGIWFTSSQTYDDALLVDYTKSNFFDNPGVYSLVKTRAYSWFLIAVHKSGLPYSVVLSLLWSVIAAVVFAIVLWVSKKKGLSFIVFSYVLFYPSAFEAWLGTRLYRNSIIVPCLILTFSLMIFQTFLISKDESHHLLLMIGAIILGISFSFTFYIKEDGIWILCCLIALAIVDVFLLIKKIKNKEVGKREILIRSISLILPFIIFTSVTYYYKNRNYHYFGVAEIQTRTEGELGEFVNNIYQIDSTYRTANIWAPADAIEKAYSVSKTFQKYPDLFNHIMNNPWYGGLSEDNQIQGDFLTWVLRTALEETGLWTSESEVSTIFEQINNEIEEAFENGELQKSNRIQIVSSVGGRTLEEIFDLLPYVCEEYIGTIFLYGYNPGSCDGELGNIEISQYASELCNTSYLRDYSSSGIDHLYQNKIINLIFYIYRVINAVLLLALIVTLVFGIIKWIKNSRNKTNNRQNNLIIFLIIAMLIVQLAYSFSIAWFSSFLFQNGIDLETMNFYTPGMVALLIWIYILSILWINNDRKCHNKSICN